MKETAKKLRAEDAKKWTQAKLAKALGMAQPTVAKWFASNIIGADNATKPDARVKVNPKKKPDIAAANARRAGCWRRWTLMVATGNQAHVMCA